jgi:Arc/MetJ-type ribon-helix-helix transcriptional regulator
MGKMMTLNVRVSGPLGEFVAAKIGDDGVYENVSEYVRDLIRQDRDRAERAALVRLKAELAVAFAAPDDSYEALTAAEVIARNQRG